jgi:hypothetical protein
VERPGVVTFVGILVLIKSGVALVTGAALFIARGGDQAASAGISDDSLMTGAVTEIMAALILYLVAWNLLKGRKGARLLVAIAVGIQLASTVWVMLDHGSGGYLYTGLISAAFSLFILWALYGDDRSNKYFNAPLRSA